MRNLQLPGRSPVLAPNGMVSTSQPCQQQLASCAARGAMLDAALAAVAVQCVVEPASTGIGGDCFCLYAPAGTDEVIAINGSGRAPLEISADWLLTRRGQNSAIAHARDCANSC